MKKAILLIMLYNFIPSYGDVEFLARNGNSDAINAIQNDKAEKFIPNYSVSAANQAGNEFDGMDDGALKAKADQRIVEAKTSKTATPTATVVQTSERPVLDNFEQTQIFEKANEVYADPAKKLAEIVSKDCRETINDSTDPYTREMYTEEKTDIEYEEKVCEKPTDNVVCERSLEVKCEATQECEMGGIVQGSLDTGMEWNYTYPRLRLGTVGVYYFNCGHACHKETRFAKFKIQNKDAIRSFRLKKLFLNNLLMIKFNGVTVYNSLGGDRLEIANIYDPGSYINAGNGRSGHCLINAGRKTADDVDIDLFPHLVEGENTIDMELVYSFYGHIHFEIEARQQCCTKLSDKWETKCWQS